MSEPARVSVVLKSVIKGPGIAQEAREAIQAGLTRPEYRPHPACPCERCARAFGIIP